MEDIKARLLPAKPSPSPILNPRDASYRPSPFGRQPFQGVDGPSSFGRQPFQGVDGPSSFGRQPFQGVDGPSSFGRQPFQGVDGPSPFVRQPFQGVDGPSPFVRQPFQGVDGPSSFGRQPFQGVDVLGLKKRGQGLRSWIRVDATTGDSQVIEVDKFTMMRRCDLPARDLRLLDPLFVYPSTILGREKAIVVNLEQIRCIITSDEVLLLNSLDSYVLQYVVELQRRLKAGGGDDVWQSESSDFNRRRGGRTVRDMFGGTSADYLPFEFKALEVALEAACTFLDTQASELEIEAYPLLDELTSKISTANLERVRRLKSRLVALTRRVQKVRDEIEQLMDDDGDMAEMYLTEKKRRMESLFSGEQSIAGYRSVDGALSISAPVSPVSSPPDCRRLEKNLSLARSRHESTRSSESATEHIDELEMLLEAYFVVTDSTLNKLTSLKEYIDDTEDFINIQLDNVRNQLIQFELLLTTGTFVVAIFGVVAGVFGMNFEIKLFDSPSAFKWVLVLTGVFGAVLFGSFLWFFRHRRLMPL